MNDQFVPSEENPDEESEPDWKLYEKAIAHIEESYEDCAVTRNHHLVGRRSGIRRQIDVWLEATVGADHPVTVAIECRRYEGEPVGIKDVEAFISFLDDVGANKGVMMSHSGYTNGAQKRAASAGVELRVLSLVEAEEFDWEEFVQESCQIPDCFGTIGWSYEDGRTKAGHCNNCGTFYIECGTCGDVSWYNGGDLEKCASCGTLFYVKKEKREICGIKEDPPQEAEEPEDAEEES